MIKVYVRHFDETERYFLGRFNTEDLPQLVKSFKDNQIYFDGIDLIEKGDISSQYFCGSSKAFYEIVIAPED